MRWYYLASMISLLGNLTRLVFKAHEPFPQVLLDVLHKHHPSAKLEIENFSYRPAELRYFDENPLEHSPCLNAISFDMIADGSNFRMKIPFVRTIRLAPNLQKIRLRIYHRRSRLVPWPGYATESRAVKKPVQQLDLQGISLENAWTVQYWQEFLDFSQLQSL